MAIPILAPLAALAALAATALGYRWRRDIWSWITRTPPPAAAAGRLRVLVAGPTGIGKTTLIRHVVGSDVGVIGEGAPVTPGVEWLGRPEFPVWFADTKGIEMVSAAAQVADLSARVAGWPAADTMTRIDAGWMLEETVARAGLFAVATPQAFRAGVLRDAAPDGGNGVREAAAVLGPVPPRPVAPFVRLPGGGRDPLRRRASCCLAYSVPGAATCSTCPRLP